MKNYQDKVRKFVSENELEAKPEFRVLDIMSELGEVSKELLKMTEYGQSKEKYRKEIEDEMGDLMFSVICLANTYNLDLEQALNNALDKYKERLKKGSAGSEVLGIE